MMQIAYRGLRLIFLIFSLNSVHSPSWAQGVNSDTLRKYSWIKPELNYVQYYHKAVMQSFHDKWSGAGRVVVAHFGDSHVQSDIYPGALRNDLQAVRGQGGFGMTFPYSTAKTYSAIDYFSSHTGTWLFAKSIEFKPKLPLGLSGATAKTFNHEAGFKIKFKKTLPQEYRKLKIYCRQQKSSFDFVARSGAGEVFVNVDSAATKPVEVILQALDSTIEIQLVKNFAYQTQFEFYGMSVESVSPGGVLLHCLGIGGSRYGSLLEEVLLDEQLPTLQADLIILDFGTNDFLYDNRIPFYLEDQIVRVIRKVRKSAPNAMVLLTTTQDMYRRQQDITAAGQFSDLIRKISKAQQCPFYDWYWISGGPERMMDWTRSRLAQRDMIHLTLKGYTLKGQMLADAIIKSLSLFANASTPDSMIFNVDSLKQLSNKRPDSVMQAATLAKPVVIAGASAMNMIRHKIVRGETLKSIARLYGVSVDDLKRTNGLQSSRIVEGNYLNVETFRTDLGTKSNVTPVKGVTIEETYTTHKVQKGETLSELAEQYKVTVKRLKKINGLKSSRINAGQILKIRTTTTTGS